MRRSITRTLELKEDAQLFEGTGVAPNVLGLGSNAGIFASVTIRRMRKGRYNPALIEGL